GSCRQPLSPFLFAPFFGLSTLSLVACAKAAKGRHRDDRAASLRNVCDASLLQARTAFAAREPLITVHKDPSCGCCSGWVQHLQDAGFVTKVLETKDIDAVKKRLNDRADRARSQSALRRASRRMMNERESAPDGIFGNDRSPC